MSSSPLERGDWCALMVVRVRSYGAGSEVVMGMSTGVESASKAVIDAYVILEKELRSDKKLDQAARVSTKISYLRRRLQEGRA